MQVPLEPAELASWVDGLRKNGWQPVPLRSGSKEPIPNVRWKAKRFTGQGFVQIAKRHGDVGIGLRLDELAVIDIDADDQPRASHLRKLAELIVGDTPAIRIGRHPRLVMVYRAAPDVAAWRIQGLVECLTGSMYIVGFGIHPQTLKPYEWVGEGRTPLDLAIHKIPVATADTLERFRIASDPAPLSPPTFRSVTHVAKQDCARQNAGRIEDDRDAFLRDLVAAEIGRLKAEHKPLARGQIVQAVWHRFQTEANLRRPKSRGGGVWTIRDVEAKVGYALRPSRSARINAAQAKGFWTFPRKLALKQIIDADPQLTKTDQTVAWAMIEAIRDERGLSFCSSTTLAHQTGLHAATVRASRLRLVQHRYFEVVRKGGQNRSTVLTPNRKLVDAVHAVGLNSWMPVPQVFSAPQAENDDHTLQVTDSKQGNVPFVASTTTVILTSGGVGQLALFPGMDDPLAFGRWVREQRLRLRLPQRVLAEKIGVRQPHLANVECGRDRLSAWSSQRLRDLVVAA